MPVQPLIHQWDTTRYHIDRAGGLIDRNGLAERWDISRTRVHQYVKMDDFPEPVPMEGKAEVWLVAEVEDWKRDREEKFA